jgi:hypothetical protein
LSWNSVRPKQNELDVLPTPLLEGTNDFPEHVLLLGVEWLVPPDDEIGGLGAQRRQDRSLRQERRLERAWWRLSHEGGQHGSFSVGGATG